MTTHPDPDDIRRAGFRVVFRGFDQEEVAARLDQLAKTVEDLIEDRDRLSSRLGEFADRDLKTEFETVGREVTSVLEAARTAAETLREKASTDAARWRSEAIAEVEAQRKEARSDSEALRTDAWTTASQLLDQTQAEVEKIRTAAERDSLAVRGEAEREAHRLTASARREAEDVVRNAKMESERLVTQARSEHDEIIATAHRQAEAAQERTRALEQRRKDLMAELEQVRSTLTSFEGELEEKRQGIGLSEPVELPRRAVISDEAGTRVEDWEEGHTVRVIRPDRSDEPPGEEANDSADAEILAAEVARLREQRGVEPPPAESPPDDGSKAAITEDRPASEPEPPAAVDAEEVPSSEKEPEPEREPELQPKLEPDRPDDSNDVFDLFRRLREPRPDSPHDETDSPDPEVVGAPEPDPTRGVPPVAEETETDAFETRERLLLPVTNDALRAVKRALADAQNHALERLRVTDGEWTPDLSELESSLAGGLQELTDGASEAGREAAAEMGITVSDPPGPEPATTSIAFDLVEALIAGMESSGPDSRDRAKAVSRIFRAWRTDEAERRVRFLALAGYHRALSHALEGEGTPWRWIPAGRLCPTCRTAADAGDALPPAHRDCNCTIVPA